MKGEGEEKLMHHQHMAISPSLDFRNKVTAITGGNPVLNTPQLVP